MYIRVMIGTGKGFLPHRLVDSVRATCEAEGIRFKLGWGRDDPDDGLGGANESAGPLDPCAWLDQVSPL